MIYLILKFSYELSNLLLDNSVISNWQISPIDGGTPGSVPVTPVEGCTDSLDQCYNSSANVYKDVDCSGYSIYNKDAQKNNK